MRLMKCYESDKISQWKIAPDIFSDYTPDYDEDIGVIDDYVRAHNLLKFYRVLKRGVISNLRYVDKIAYTIRSYTYYSTLHICTKRRRK